MHLWMQEAERLGLWAPGEMLPIPPVPDLGFSPNDKPADFTSVAAIPAPPVVVDSKISDSAVRRARMQSLYDCALSWGVRAGMREQFAHIQRVLKREDVAKMLDSAFDFGPVMLTRYLTPPVVTESRDELAHQGANKMSLRKARYRVISQSRFTSVKPNWRGFMHQVYAIDNERNSCDASSFSMLAGEKSWWSAASTAARRQGVQAANLVFSNALERLATQHTGMLKYHEWVWRGLLDVPHVAQSDYMLSMDSARQEARLNEKLLRLTYLPRFSDNRSTWNTAAPHTEESEAAAIDLALPVCSGQGCTNNQFADGGLRHSQSEDYFIHPTLMLRGGGGHANADQVAAQKAAKRASRKRGAHRRVLSQPPQVGQTPVAVQVLPPSSKAKAAPAATQTTQKKAAPVADVVAPVTVPAKPADIAPKGGAAPADTTKNDKPSAPAGQPQVLPTDNTTTPDMAAMRAAKPAEKTNDSEKAQPQQVKPAKQAQEQPPTPAAQEGAAATKKPAQWRAQAKASRGNNSKVSPEAKRLAQEIIKAKDAEWAKSANGQKKQNATPVESK